MAKLRLTSYTFDASAKTILASQFSDVGLAGIQLITNVTDGIIIYNFADASKGGTLSTDTLTLEYDTTSMDDADELMILVEDGVQTSAVTVSSLPLPTGASSSAKQDTIIGHVDGIETAIASTNTKLDTIITNTADTESAVDGLETLIGTTNSTLTTIDGRVDGIETLIGTTNSTLSTIDGRVDGLETLVTSTNTKLDTVNTNLTTIDGRVDGLEASNSAIQTSVQLIDDAIVADDAAFTPATTKVMMSGFEYDDTSPDSVNEGDAGAARMSANRNQYMQIRDNAGNERGANVNASSELLVALSSVPSHAVTNAGTFAVQENGAALTALQLIDNPVVVDDAAFTPATTSVMMAGFEFDDTSPDSVNEGDAGAARMSANRNIYTTLRDAAGNERGANVNASNQLSVSVDNTVTVASHAVTVASGGIASGAIASGAVASGAVASGAIASGAFAAGSIAAGAIAKGATSPVAAEDDASADLDYGMKILAVRKATPANTSGTDGDYEMPQMSAGRLWTSATIDSALPAGTNAIGKLSANSGVDIGDVDVTTVIPGTGATNLGKAEDAAHASGDTGVAILAVRSDTLAATSGTTGDYEMVHTDSVGAVWTRDTATLADDAAFTVGTSRVLPVGLMADETSTDSVDEGDVGVPRMTLNRKQIVAVRSTTPTLSNVSASASSVTVLAANSARDGATIWNDSSAILYLKLGATASATSCTVKMVADAYYEVPYGYTGIIDGIWASATGSARVTEIT